jgi:hypothetical protein
VPNADETYEFDMQIAKAQPIEEYAPSRCPECGAPIRIYLDECVTVVPPSCLFEARSP